MYSDGKTVYSYGSHFPIATWLDTKTIVFNKDKYSSSTGRHQGAVLRKIPEGVNVIYTDTDGINQALSNNGFIYNCEEKKYSYEEMLKIIEQVFRSKRVKRFPKQKIDEFLGKLLVMDAI